MIDKIIYMAPLHVQSGLGTAARGYYDALKLTNYPIECISIDDGHELHPKVDCEITEYTKNSIDNSNNILIVNQNSHAFELILKNHEAVFNLNFKKKIAIWVWELESPDAYWCKYTEMLDEIWVPSNFVKNSLRKITNIPIHVIPYPIYNIKPSKTNYRNQFGISDSDILLGYIFDSSSFVERKNPLVLIKLIENYKNEKLHLLLKINHYELFINYLKANNCVLKKDNIHIINNKLDADELYGLISELDYYVSPHRSEGFGLTMAESMALGTPVIGTNYSGSEDFLSSETGYPIPFSLKSLGIDHGPYSSNQHWADIDVQSLYNLMNKIVNKEINTTKKIENAKLFIENNFSLKAISRIINQIL